MKSLCTECCSIFIVLLWCRCVLSCICDVDFTLLLMAVGNVENAILKMTLFDWFTFLNQYTFTGEAK